MAYTSLTVKQPIIPLLFLCSEGQWKRYTQIRSQSMVGHSVKLETVAFNLNMVSLSLYTPVKTSQVDFFGKIVNNCHAQAIFAEISMCVLGVSQYVSVLMYIMQLKKSAFNLICNFVAFFCFTCIQGILLHLTIHLPISFEFTLCPFYLF